jgi:hypothetical protein
MLDLSWLWLPLSSLIKLLLWTARLLGVPNVCIRDECEECLGKFKAITLPSEERGLLALPSEGGSKIEVSFGDEL